jgi:hypothetical protein
VRMGKQRVRVKHKKKRIEERGEMDRRERRE